MAKAPKPKIQRGGRQYFSKRRVYLGKGTGHQVAEIRFSSEEYTATLSF